MARNDQGSQVYNSHQEERGGPLAGVPDPVDDDEDDDLVDPSGDDDADDADDELPPPASAKPVKPGTRQPAATAKVTGELPWWAKAKPGEMTKTAEEQRERMQASKEGRRATADEQRDKGRLQRQ